MDRINKLLPSSIKKVGAGKTVRAAMVLDAVRAALDEQFGDDIASSMKPTIFKNGTVTIRCDRSVYAQEIALHEVDVLRLLDARVGQGMVRRLRPVS